jgi:hypothetical protein
MQKRIFFKNRQKNRGTLKKKEDFCELGRKKQGAMSKTKVFF